MAISSVNVLIEDLEGARVVIEPSIPHKIREKALRIFGISVNHLIAHLWGK